MAVHRKLVQRLAVKAGMVGSVMSNELTALYGGKPLAPKTQEELFMKLGMVATAKEQQTLYRIIYGVS